jgi:hypothetical protein
VLAGQEERLKALVNATPDATLAELREELPTTAALSTLWLALDRLGLTVKKRYTPKNSVGLMSQPPGACGARRCRSAMRDSTSSSTNRASPRTCYAAMPAAFAGRALAITRHAAIGRRTPSLRRCVPQS